MIRHAVTEDLDTILAIVDEAKQYMRRTGNLTQWSGNYPLREDFQEDIENERLYVCFRGEMIYGVFAFIIGEDANYAYIENGKWLNGKPYGTLHRIASSGLVKGVFGECVEFAKAQTDNLRIDTHEDNRTMRHLIEKHGFVRCGIVYMEDGSPRIGYQYEGKQL